MTSTLDTFNKICKQESAFLMLAFKNIVSEEAYAEFCRQGERLLSDKQFIHDSESYTNDLDKKGYLSICTRDADDPVELGFVIQKKTLDGLMMDPAKVVSASITPGSPPGRAIIYTQNDLLVQHVFYATEEGIERKLQNNANRFKSAKSEKELFFPIMTELYAQFLIYTLQKVPRKFVANLVNYESKREEDIDQNNVDTVPPERTTSDLNSLPPEYNRHSFGPLFMQAQGTISDEDDRRDILQKYAKELRKRHEVYKYAISAQILDALGMNTTNYLPEGLASQIYFLKSNSAVRFVENMTNWTENRYFEKGLVEFSRQCQTLPIRKVRDIEAEF